MRSLVLSFGLSGGIAYLAGVLGWLTNLVVAAVKVELRNLEIENSPGVGAAKSGICRNLSRMSTQSETSLSKSEPPIFHLFIFKEGLACLFSYKKTRFRFQNMLLPRFQCHKDCSLFLFIE